MITESLRVGPKLQVFQNSPGDCKCSEFGQRPRSTGWNPSMPQLGLVLGLASPQLHPLPSPHLLPLNAASVRAKQGKRKPTTEATSTVFPTQPGDGQRIIPLAMGFLSQSPLFSFPSLPILVEWLCPHHPHPHPLFCHSWHIHPGVGTMTGIRSLRPR